MMSLALALLPLAHASTTTTAVQLPPAPICETEVTVEVSAAFPALTVTSWKNPQARTMKQAQDFAAREGVCTLRMVVHPGVYAESLVIDRATHLVAAPFAAPPTIQGSLDNPHGHALSLVSVDLIGGIGFGVRQVGGALTLIDVSVRDVRSAKGTGGVAVSASGRAEVRAEDVFLSYNDGGALRIEGPGTRLHLSGAEVFGNLHAPDAIDPSDTAAVAVVDGARAFVQDSGIAGNLGVGLAASGAGTGVHFRDGYVDDTRTSATQEGTNLLVTGGASLELRSWTSTGAEVVGLMERQGLLRSSQGLLGDNRIGATLETATDDCFYETRYTGNALDQAFDEIEMPTFDQVKCQLDGSCPPPPPPPPCADVPWED